MKKMFVVTKGALVILLSWVGSQVCHANSLTAPDYSPYEAMISLINATNETSLAKVVGQIEGLAAKKRSKLRSFLQDWIIQNLSCDLGWVSASDCEFSLDKCWGRGVWTLNRVFDYGMEIPNEQIDQSYMSRLLIEANRRDVQRAIDRAFAGSGTRENEIRENGILARLGTMSEEEKLILASEEDSDRVLMKLAGDTNRTVRLCVVKNPRASSVVLRELAKDGDQHIAALAKKNMRLARSVSLPTVPKWPNLILPEIVLAKDVVRLRSVCEDINSLQNVPRSAALSWLAEHLDDLRYAPALGGPPSEGEHDLSLVGGKCAWLLEQILGVKLIPVTRRTPKEVLEQQKQRIASLVQTRFMTTKNSESELNKANR